MDLEITLRVNGATHRLSIDTRTTLLGALRERLGTLVRTLLDLTTEEGEKR